MHAAKVLVFCAFISALTSGSLEKTDELNNSVEEELEMMMSEINNHCGVINHPKSGSRQKRQSEQNLNDRLRNSLLGCLNRTVGRCDNSTSPSETTTTPTTTFTTTSSPPISGPCSSPDTVNLTEYWRKDHQGSQILPVNGTYACDRALQRGTTWFRFSGAAGNQLANRCVPTYSCGSHGGFWSDAQMPSTVGETIRVPIYGSLRGNCKWYSWPISHPMTVQRCSNRPGDFVYKVHGTASCFWAFCGMDVAS